MPLPHWMCCRRQSRWQQRLPTPCACGIPTKTSFRSSSSQEKRSAQWYNRSPLALADLMHRTEGSETAVWEEHLPNCSSCAPWLLITKKKALNGSALPSIDPLGLRCPGSQMPWVSRSTRHTLSVHEKKLLLDVAIQRSAVPTFTPLLLSCSPHVLREFLSCICLHVRVRFPTGNQFSC